MNKDKMDVEEISEMPIWNVEFSHNAKENQIPSHGLCGYLAMDQIVNNDNRCLDTKDKKSRTRLAATIRTLLEERRERLREKRVLQTTDDDVETPWCT